MKKPRHPKRSLPTLSPYLETFWNGVLVEKGWNAKDLSTAAGVSYGYTRKIVNGTLIPSRDALRRLCSTTGQDFVTVWRSLNQEQYPEQAITNEGKNENHAEKTPATNAVRKRLLDVFDHLSPEGQLIVLESALQEKHFRKRDK
jgi:transcriptional regulator with XRE-family HTH domain